MLHEYEPMCDKNACLFTDHGYCTADIDGIAPNISSCKKFKLSAVSTIAVKMNREIKELLNEFNE